MDAFSIAISIGLQSGVPLETYVSKFVNMRFEPMGLTDDPDVRTVVSLMDYIFRRLALDYLPYDKRAQLGIFTNAERVAQVRGEVGDDLQVAAVELDGGAAQPDPLPPTAVATESSVVAPPPHHATADAPLCFTCGTKMRPAGSCYVCEGCGSTSGCS
jgi:ribonucleoside-diphosphate reductase alpha chain